MNNTTLVESFDGALVPYKIKTDCGTATFDDGAGYGYRCDYCNAVIGSIGMPRECAELMCNNMEKDQVWKILNDQTR